MESITIRISDEKKEARARAISARIKELVRERRRLIAEGQESEAMPHGEIAKRAIAEIEAEESAEHKEAVRQVLKAA